MKSTVFFLSLIGVAFAALPNTYYETTSQQQVLNGALDAVVLNGHTFDAGPDARRGFSLNLVERRLVQMEGKAPIWMTELEKIEAKANGIPFFDITDTPMLGPRGVQSTVAYPTLSAHKQVTRVINTLTTEVPRALLKEFSSFRTRHYKSEITAEAANPELRSVITVSADDDGSGTVTILESYRALLTSGFQPQLPVEFHWYSAEEGGLLGSQAVAKSYQAHQFQVYAMSQFDMTAWVKVGVQEHIGVITDYVDSSLTEFNKKLIDTYLNVPYIETKCGYACSDHASWARAGYPSIFTIESSFEHANHANIHTMNDRMDISSEFSFDHMLEFSKLAVAFAIELAGWEM
ncbi:hypothetical protein ID866_7048 [Astraeus odoratus]|nr:hypothetical protein ID866_7048 [Astraeus odoratus]